MRRFTPLQLFIVVFVGVVTPAMFVFGFYYLHVAFPEEARKENLNSKYAQLLDDLDNAMALSNSSESLTNQLNNIKFPIDTLAVSVQDWSRERIKPLTKKRKKRIMTKEIVIFDRRTSNNKLSELSDFSAISDGVGHGAKDGQHYWILHHRVDQYGYDFIEVLLERQMPEIEE